MKSTIKNGFSKVNILKVVAISFLLGGCSSSLPQSGESEQLALLPADEMKQGPGLFSGADGAFNILKRDKKLNQPAETTTTAAKGSQNSVSKMNLDETSKVLDDKIKQLEKDRKELELLKLQIDKRIQGQ